jgi:hypothetical protein
MPSWPIIGAMLNSALYLSAVFIASIVENNALVLTSIALGVAAGLAILPIW